jgi:hypothetical protein
MEYRISKKMLFEVLRQWNTFLKRKVHVIACGGTAMTLLDVKASTKDIDFIVPNEKEYAYLLRTLKTLGYEEESTYGVMKKGDIFIFDLFPGKRIYTTELLESPLKEGNNATLKEFSHLYIGVLNDYDLISSKLFRGTDVDLDDCLMLFKMHRMRIDWGRLEKHFYELASYDVSEEKAIKHFSLFKDLVRKEGLHE